MRDDDGTPIDGDFTGAFPTGNHHAGGNFEFEVNPDTGPTPLVRMSTTAGVITLQLFGQQKPITTANFLSYADAGDYDGIFFTRSIDNFVAQAGSLQVDNTDDSVEPTPVNPPIQNEFSTGPIISNTLGTVAFAKVSPQLGSPPTNSTINSATNQFFFNLGDNGQGSGRSDNLDAQNGGFTVFARAANASSLATMNAISNYTTVALANPATGDGVLQSVAGTDLSDTPVQNPSALSLNLENVGTAAQPQFQYVATGGFDPQSQLIVIRRTAVLAHVSPLVVPD
jgi:cyclophilin family peptidyl-prolyl cis-trans isomerase